MLITSRMESKVASYRLPSVFLIQTSHRQPNHSTAVVGSSQAVVVVAGGMMPCDPVVQASDGQLWLAPSPAATVDPRTPGWPTQSSVLRWRLHRRHCLFACLLSDVHAGLREVGPERPARRRRGA